MKHIYFKDDDLNGEGIFSLSDETPDGSVVLIISGSVKHADGEYKASDLVLPEPYPCHAGTIAFNWLCDREVTLSDEEVDLAERFLRQWPEGPQPEQVESSKASVEHLMSAAHQLDEGEQKLTEDMTAEELRDALFEMTASLADYQPDEPIAEVIRARMHTAILCLYLATRGDKLGDLGDD